MGIAREVSTWSKDPSRQIGAVAVGEKGQILAQGYNGFPRGIKDSDERYSDREKKYKYVVHAEMNCIYNASWNGVSLNNSIFYVYGLPVCSECAKGLIQVGVKKVVVQVPNQISIPINWLKHEKTTKELFREAGIEYAKL
tara:strand:+ start:232 stop:651 length:420 start_codon:yes stop_codon:yes gene_type:complete